MRIRVWGVTSLLMALAVLAGVVLLPLSAAAAGKSAAAGEMPRTAEEWFRRGALVSTYGNYPGAVRAFSKAIALDPHHGGAWFSQGVAYGQMGNFDKALEDINRAISLEPNNGIYRYGRGRVHLLAGDPAAAMQDFKRAADLGDEDAQDFLKKNPQ